MGVNVAKLADILRSEGFNITGTDPLTDEADGAVHLGPRWHVQVGHDYYVIYQEFQEQFIIRGETSMLNEVLQMLRKLKHEIY